MRSRSLRCRRSTRSGRTPRTHRRRLRQYTIKTAIASGLPESTRISGQRRTRKRGRRRRPRGQRRRRQRRQRVKRRSEGAENAPSWLPPHAPPPAAAGHHPPPPATTRRRLPRLLPHAAAAATARERTFIAFTGLLHLDSPLCRVRPVTARVPVSSTESCTEDWQLQLRTTHDCTAYSTEYTWISCGVRLWRNGCGLPDRGLSCARRVEGGTRLLRSNLCDPTDGSGRRGGL
mmetsp:Transcript_9322/g.20992  ORF Transcript_9322/g.20992 Transcript_9322/m.20992 type:complete len:232 (-) Transcript_9322:110-805(-)